MSHPPHDGPAVALARWHADHPDATLAELSRRGVIGHPTVVAVTDGALWIREVLDWQCPHAVRILDVPHAAGWLATATQASFGPGTAGTSEWYAS